MAGVPPSSKPVIPSPFRTLIDPQDFRERAKAAQRTRLLLSGTKKPRVTVRSGAGGYPHAHPARQPPMYGGGPPPPPPRGRNTMSPFLQGNTPRRGVPPRRPPGYAPGGEVPPLHPGWRQRLHGATEYAPHPRYRTPPPQPRNPYAALTPRPHQARAFDFTARSGRSHDDMYESLLGHKPPSTNLSGRPSARSSRRSSRSGNSDSSASSTASTQARRRRRRRRKRRQRRRLRRRRTTKGHSRYEGLSESESQVSDSESSSSASSDDDSSHDGSKKISKSQRKAMMSLLREYLPDSMTAALDADMMHRLKAMREKGYTPPKGFDKKNLEKEVEYFHLMSQRSQQRSRRDIKNYLKTGSFAVTQLCNLLNVDAIRTDKFDEVVDQAIQNGDFEDHFDEVAPYIRDTPFANPVFSFLMEVFNLATSSHKASIQAEEKVLEEKKRQQQRETARKLALKRKQRKMAAASATGAPAPAPPPPPPSRLRRSALSTPTSSVPERPSPKPKPPPKVAPSAPVRVRQNVLSKPDTPTETKDDSEEEAETQDESAAAAPSPTTAAPRRRRKTFQPVKSVGSSVMPAQFQRLMNGLQKPMSAFHQFVQDQDALEGQDDTEEAPLPNLLA